MPDLKTNEERRAEGRALRVAVPRSSHAGWVSPPDRSDRAIVAVACADLTEQDHPALQQAVADGRTKR